jgi:hypothetical protein
MGLKVSEGEDLPVRGDGRETVTAEIVAETGCDYPVGLRRSGDRYEIVADWYRVELHTDLRRGSFCERLQQAYSRRIVLAQARAQNLVVEEERQEDGEIVILLSERE